MTKIELIKMLENVDDNAELTFVVSEYNDYDIYPNDKKVNVYNVLAGEVIRVRHPNGRETYENLTEEFEYVEKKNINGVEIGYWQKKKI